jgi:ABC-type multidrug transport system fused ATPase/permease subunit
MFMGKPDSKSDQRDKRLERSSTFKHFRRLLSYVWPQKRFLIPAFLCILVMAITYSASIASILPVLTTIVEEEGLHGWVDKQIAQQRYDCLLSVYDPVTDSPMEGSIQVSKFKDETSPLQQNGVEDLDFIVSVNGHSDNPSLMFRELATAEKLNLAVVDAENEQKSQVTLQPPPLPWLQDTAHQAVQLIPRGVDNRSRMHTLLFVLGLLLTLVLVGNIARFFAQYLTVLLNTRAIIDIRREMYEHVLKLPLSRFSENTSDMMTRFMQDMNDIFRGLNNFFSKLVAEPFKAAGVITVALWLNWQLTLVLLLGSPAAAYLFRKLGKIIRRANKKLLAGYGRMLSRLESTLNGMRVVKSYNRENHERKQLFKVDRVVLRMQLRMGLIESLTSPFIETLAFVVGAAAISFIAYRMLIVGDIQEPGFVTMLACMGAIFDPVRKLSTVYPKLQRANAAAARIFELIDTPTEYDQDNVKPSIKPLQRSIDFDHVTFYYPKSDRPAVNDVCLSVKKNEIIALVGPNGCGKTTLLSLLPRLFNPNSGRILIDDQDIRDVSLRSLRQQFGIITQESVIFPDTIRGNIAYGRPSATEEEIREASRKAFAEEFIQQLPEGYDTQVGEHGATLSGGQRQRLAIARAILRNAPILIFDEATSQVDPESELKIHQALEAILENRTAFIIAHRYSTVSGADRIAVMDDGQVVAVGSHKQLLQSCPLYQRLYETQFRNAG